MTRAEAIEKIKFLSDHSCNYYIGKENGIALDMALEALEQLEQKKGKWMDMGDYCVCNQCWHTEQHHTNFCSKCGAKMEVE